MPPRTSSHPWCLRAVAPFAVALALLSCTSAGDDANVSEASPLLGSPPGYWQDDWRRWSADIGGTCSSGPECHAGYIPLRCDSVPNRWLTMDSTVGACSVAGPNRCVAPEPVNGHLYFHGEDLWNNGFGWEGFPLYSNQTFPKDGYISVEVTARAYCGPWPGAGCFAGLVLYNGESNYRQMAYLASPGETQLAVWRYAGDACNPSPLASGLEQNSWHKLRLDYFGQDGGKWVYYLDDVVREIEVETPTNPGAVLRADPRVAFIFAAADFGRWVEGSLQTLRVWTGDTLTQSQTSRVDGYGTTDAIRFAQRLWSPGANVTRARLFFGAVGQRVVVSAYTDDGGIPGTLINETSYTTTRAGAQDVPLWVPGEFNPIWLVVRGQSEAMADIGTSAPATDPYPGELLYSGDHGRTWSPADRDLYFEIFTRG